MIHASIQSEDNEEQPPPTRETVSSLEEEVRSAAPLIEEDEQSNVPNTTFFEDFLSLEHYMSERELGEQEDETPQDTMQTHWYLPTQTQAYTPKNKEPQKSKIHDNDVNLNLPDDKGGYESVLRNHLLEKETGRRSEAYAIELPGGDESRAVFQKFLRHIRNYKDTTLDEMREEVADAYKASQQYAK